MSARRDFDRRALLGSGAAAALLAASGLSLDAQPRRGGHLRIAAADADGVMMLARMAVFDTLTEVAPDGGLRGELATDWTGGADAKTWRLSLRDDAVFHDGRPFAPEDALGALAAPFSPVAPMIADMRTVSGALEVALLAPDPDFPYRLSDPALAVGPGGPVPESMGDWVGTGLYHLVRGAEGRHFLGRRMDDHYKDGRAGWFDAVDAITVTDLDVRVEALRDGHVDVIEAEAEEKPALTASNAITTPRVVSGRARLDDWRIGERWWRA